MLCFRELSIPVIRKILSKMANFLISDTETTVVSLVLTIACSSEDNVANVRLTKFSERTQCDSHYDIQDHSGSPILVPIESS